MIQFAFPKQEPLEAYYILILRVFLHNSLKNQPSDHSEMEGQGSVPAGLNVAAATPPNQPQRCILTDYFNNYNFSQPK
jgi:hypothetical protein